VDQNTARDVSALVSTNVALATAVGTVWLMVFLGALAEGVRRLRPQRPA